MNNTTGHAHDATAWLSWRVACKNNSFSSLANWGTGQPAQRAGAYAAV